MFNSKNVLYLKTCLMFDNFVSVEYSTFICVLLSELKFAFVSGFARAQPRYKHWVPPPRVKLVLINYVFQRPSYFHVSVRTK
jgi:hypothetical protein